MIALILSNIQECHHVEQLKQSTKGTEEWDKEFHPSLILSVTASSYGPDKRGRKTFIIYVWNLKINNFQLIIIKRYKKKGERKILKFTAGLAPSVKKMSFGLEGNPSRASIPAAIASRNPLIP